MDSRLRIVPLGGLGRIGGNMMAYETETDVVVVDAGVLFPGADQPGVDYIIPDVAYLRERRDKMRGYVLTHGHEDHIGALPFILGDVPAPVYGTEFTLALVSAKLAEFPEIHADLRPVRDRESIAVGKIQVDPVPVTHSIPGAVALIMQTPIGTVVHTGDFKFDPHPVDGRLSDTEALRAAGDAGVALLLSDSTNAERAGHTWSEREVGIELDQQIATAPHRVLLTTFASHLHRVQLVIDASERAGRHIVVVGRSMQANVQMGLERGFIRARAGTLVDPSRLATLARNRVTVIASGSQGEPESAMSRIAAGTHNVVKIDTGDRVLMSSRRIPGNEHAIGIMVNHMVKLGAEVIDDRVARVHTSGHAFNDEQREMIELCRPLYFIPIHGEYRHLGRHASLAQHLGVAANHVFITEDGKPLDVSARAGHVMVRRGEPAPAGHIYVDGTGVGDIGEVVLRDRRVLAETGMVICVAIFDEEGNLASGPDLVTRGVVQVDTNQELLSRAVEEVRAALHSLGTQADSAQRADTIRQTLRRFFRREKDRRPLILPLVMEV